MLQRAVAFADLGADYLDRVDKHRQAPGPPPRRARLRRHAPPQARQLSPPWHSSTPDPAHPCEFSGQPPKFKLSGNEANASVDLRHGKLHVDGGQAYDAVQTRNACLGPVVTLA